MSKTAINAERRIQLATITRDLLKANFLNGTNLDLTGGAGNATITGLSDGVNAGDVATKGQLDAALSGLSGNLILKGSLDASLIGSQLDNVQAGWWYKITVAGTLFATNPITLAVGDNLYCTTTVVGTPTNGSSFFKVDNTESPDILRDGDVVNNLTTSAAGSVLDASQGKILKDVQDVINGKVTDLNTLTGVVANAVHFGTFTGTTLSDNIALKALLQELETAVEAAQNPNEIYGEDKVVTNGSPVLPALTNAPTVIMGVYLNGLKMRIGSGNDYTITGSVITFEYNLSNVGQNVDVVLVDYKH